MRHKKAIIIFVVIVGVLALIIISPGKKDKVGKNIEILSEPAKLTFDEKGDEDPSIIQADDGTFYMAWLSDRNGQTDIWIKQSTDNTLNNWSPPRIVITSPHEDWYPTLLQSKNGIFHLSWMRSHDGAIDVFYTNSKDAVTWRPARQLTNLPTEDWAPHMIEDSAGTLWIAWASGRNGNDKDIFIINSKNGGASWSAPVPIITHGFEDDFPYLLQKNDGTYLMVWSRYDGKDGTFYLSNPKSEIMHATSGDGIAWSDAIQITEEVEGKQYVNILPTIYQDGTNFYIAWTSNRLNFRGNNVEILFGSLGKPYSLSDGFFPRIVPTKDGKLHMYWIGGDESNRDIFYQIFRHR